MSLQLHRLLQRDGVITAGDDDALEVTLTWLCFAGAGLEIISEFATTLSTK